MGSRRLHRRVGPTPTGWSGRGAWVHGCVLAEPLWDRELSHSRWATPFENEEAERIGGT
jgi:hypothetical protein